MTNSVVIVDNEEDYWEFIRCLRNDRRVQSGFLQRAAITPAQQREYMGKYGALFIVALVDGEPVGYAGSIDGDIRVCTSPSAWGRGVARALITELLRRFPESHARIKTTNVASIALFESCGFERVGVEGSLLLYRLPG